MRDSSKLLKFNVNRNLNFDPYRDVGFDLDRRLDFDLDRALSFDPGRDLEQIRLRGIVFRGYICPHCGALVAPDKGRCAECLWDLDVVIKKNLTSEEFVDVVLPAPKKSKDPAEGFACDVCGRIIAHGEPKCSGCGTWFVSPMTESYTGPTFDGRGDGVDTGRTDAHVPQEEYRGVGEGVDTEYMESAPPEEEVEEVEPLGDQTEEEWTTGSDVIDSWERYRQQKQWEEAERRRQWEEYYRSRGF